MFILDSNKYAKDPGKASGNVAQLIQKCGGEVLVSRLWVEQKLAYPIQGHRKGTYWLAYFRLDHDKVPLFRRECQLNENILRQLLLKVDPRLVETLVSHAQGKTVTPASDAPRRRDDVKVDVPVEIPSVEKEVIDA
jgi:small subunit ribosomal protein S6